MHTHKFKSNPCKSDGYFFGFGNSLTMAWYEWHGHYNLKVSMAFMVATFYTLYVSRILHELIM
jgi:hypothetical protein